jgi:probable metal-binding protein
MKKTFHIHDVLHFLEKEKEGLTGEELLLKIRTLFGDEALFTTCGEEVLSPAQAIEFMSQREKIILRNGLIWINRNMETC